jgi:hypothetical protein
MSSPSSIAENADIRAWARDRGIQISDRGRIGPAIRDAYHDAMDGLDPEEPGYRGDADGQDGIVRPAEVAPIPVEGPVVSRETPPVPVAEPKGIAGVRKRLAKAAAASPTRKRTSVERLVGGVWGMAARAMATSQANLPTARVLNMQAPVAGAIVDKLVKGSVVDRVLQPLARMGDKADTAMALVGPPLIVAALTRNPQMAPLLLPLLSGALETWCDIAGPEIEKQKKRAEERKTRGFDIDKMIEEIFAEVIPSAATAEAA